MYGVFCLDVKIFYNNKLTYFLYTHVLQNPVYSTQKICLYGYYILFICLFYLRLEGTRTVNMSEMWVWGVFYDVARCSLVSI